MYFFEIVFETCDTRNCTWNVYVLKMRSLVSLELILANNLINNVGLENICKGLEILLEVKWIEIDLSRNSIDNIVLLDINENLKELNKDC